jgi:hypothetical protein
LPLIFGTSNLISSFLNKRGWDGDIGDWTGSDDD